MRKYTVISMRKNYEEPLLCPEPFNGCAPIEIDIETEIRELISAELFAVLATQGEGQPYTSIISFASNSDLTNIVFSTSRETRKFNLLLKSPKVSIMVDDRSSSPPIINQIRAVTITGTSRIIKDKNEKKSWASILTNKHPYLEGFLDAPSTAVVVVDVYRYFYVRRFQEVFEWNPRGK